MIAFLIGDNLEILHSLIIGIKSPTICILREGQINQGPSGEFRPGDSDFLFLFDLNNPIVNYEISLQWVQAKFPSAPIWAIFDSKSESLNKEVLRLGFLKIVSYSDNYAELLEVGTK